MSPKSFQQEQHHYHHRDHLQVPVKQDNPTFMTPYTNDATPMMAPPSLKIHKDSHIIKKSAPPQRVETTTGCIPMRGNSPTGCTNKMQHPPQRGPVIIYTHSPKVIHTNPKDFMSLVQKLTGMCSSEGTGHKDQQTKDEQPQQQQQQQQQLVNAADASKPGNIRSINNNNIISNVDNESTPFIIDENYCTSNTCDVMDELNFGLGVPLFDPPQVIPHWDYDPNAPCFVPNSSDLLYYNSDPYINDYINSSYYPYNQTTSTAYPSLIDMDLFR